ncbi:MAG: TolC family protein [Bacteroidota bacterium]
MMRLIIIQSIFLLTGSLFNTSSGYTQEKWTLEDCIEYALEKNIAIKRQEISARQATNDYKQSKMERLPAVSGRASHSFRSGRTFSYDILEYVNQEYQYGQITLQGDLTVFSGFEAQHSIKKNEYDMKAQLSGIEEAKYDVTMNIVTYYLNVLSNIEQQQIKEEQLEVTLEQIEQTKQEVEVGNKSKGDLLEIKAQASRERLELIRAKNNLKLAYLDLKQLMNLDTTESFKIKSPEDFTSLSENAVKTSNAIYSESVNEFPSIEHAKYQMKSAEKNLKIVQSKRLPHLSLGAQYGTYYDELRKDQFNLAYDRQISENMSLVASLQLSIPIFNKRRIHNQISNAKLDVLDSKYWLEQQKQDLYKDIEKARNEVISAYEEYQSNLESLESMEEAFNYSQEKYNAGLVDIVEYRIAKNNYNSAKSDAVSSRYFYLFKMKILEFYMGKEMEI